MIEKYKTIDLKKLINYGLFLLAFFLPWQTRWIWHAGELKGDYFEYGTYSLYAIDILIIILLVLGAINYFGSRSKKAIDSGRASSHHAWGKMFWRLVAGLELMSFISVFFAPDKLLALFVYARFLLGIGLLWLIIEARPDKKRVLHYFISGTVFQALLGIWQFATQSSFASKILGIAPHNAQNLGVSVIEALGADGIGERWLRAYGGLDHPNILGGLLGCGLLFSSWLLMDRAAGKWERRLLNSALIVLTSGLLVTFSRSAWLGTACGLIFMLLLSVKRRVLYAQKIILESILIVCGIAFLITAIYPNLFVTRISATTRLEQKSLSERTDSIDIASGIIKDNWLFGTGIGNYTLAMYKFTKGSYLSYDYQPVHNVYMLCWAEIGVIGLAYFVFIFYALIKILIRNKKITVLTGIILAVMVTMLFDHYWWSLHFGIILFWWLIGTILSFTDD